ncbi:hypothetical protein ACFL6P_06860 [Candidatus Latescibacterota bacterium]
MHIDLKTEYYWEYLLNNLKLASSYEKNILYAVMSANPSELKELKKFLSALVNAELSRRKKKYYS